MKHDAYFTTPLPTLQDVANTTGATVEDLLPHCQKEPALFQRSITPQSALPWKTVERLCNQQGYIAMDYREKPKKLTNEQKAVAEYAAEFHHEYAQIHRASQNTAGLRIASIHESFRENIIEGLEFLQKTKPLSFEKVKKDLQECLQFHKSHQNLHQKISDNYSKKMEEFHGNISRSIKKGIDKTLSTPQPDLN